MFRVALFFALFVVVAAQCAEEEYPAVSPPVENFGRFEVYSREFYKVIPSNAVIEKLAGGFWWSEGPAWDYRRKRLYFSDVPQNKAFFWSEAGGVQIFLDPSAGFEGISDITGKKGGTNGLLMMPNGKLLMANHASRTMQLLDIDAKTRKEVVQFYKGKRLNSPNDMVLSRDGNVYFTDPPYGLKGIADSTFRELKFSGVYRLSPSGKLKLVTKELKFPNGIGLSPDEKYLYVANSGKTNAVLMRYTKDDDGNYGNGKVVYNFTSLKKADYPGGADGMAIASSGHIFQTGPGGLYVFNPKGELLGRMILGKKPKGQATGNCAFGGDGKDLFITSGKFLLRIRTLVGVQFP